MCIPKHFVHTGSRQNGTFKTRGNMSMRRHIRKYSQENNFISSLYKQILFILKCYICRYIDRLANIFSTDQCTCQTQPVVEWIALWIRTPQFPGSRPGGYVHYLLSV